MKCPICVEQGRKSRLYGGMGTRTAMGWTAFYDEDGAFHSHDPNWGAYGYQCSNGHSLTLQELRSCPSCDYGERLWKREADQPPVAASDVDITQAGD